MIGKIIAFLCVSSFQFSSADTTLDDNIQQKYNELIPKLPRFAKRIETCEKLFKLLAADVTSIKAKLRDIQTSTAKNDRPLDCYDILLNAKKGSGTYKIFPNKYLPSAVEVYCDMKTDGGGWTVIVQRMSRKDELISFDRDWQEYRNGFGLVKGNYWLGNEHLHLITSSRDYILRLDATDEEGNKIWGEWNTFKVDSESTNYKLRVSDFNSNTTAVDLMKYHNEMMFSTRDDDNDKWLEGSCASAWKGGWWYKHCSTIRPTGIYSGKENEGIFLKNWSKEYPDKRHASELTMKIRPKFC